MTTRYDAQLRTYSRCYTQTIRPMARLAGAPLTTRVCRGRAHLSDDDGGHRMRRLSRFTGIDDSACYWVTGMQEETNPAKKNQSMIVSGESGAGKTEVS